MLDLEFISNEVSRVAKDYPIERVSLFGSYAKGCATEHSDVDLLVEFTSLMVSLLTISSIKQKLEETLGVSVDLVHAPVPEGSFLDVGEQVLVYAR